MSGLQQPACSDAAPRSMSRAYLRATVRSVGLLIIAAATACADPEEVVIVVQTDMSVPKDIDAITIEIFTGEELQFAGTFPPPSRALDLPGTLGVVGRDPDELVTIRATALLGGVPRVSRRAITKITDSGVAMLRLPIQWLCDGQPPCLGESSSDVTRAETCVLGACVSAYVDPSKLAPYKPEDVFGGGSGEGLDGSCFDTTACFADAVDVEPMGFDCEIQAPQEANIALRTEGDGICGPHGCFVPLDVSTLLQVGGKIRLPRAVCARREARQVLGVAVSTTCPPKTERTPACGPWSLAGAREAPDSSVPVTLADGQRHPMAIAIDGTTVYWTNAGQAANDGEVKRVPRDGGTPVKLPSKRARPSGLVVHDGGDGAGLQIYWLDDGSETIYTAPADSGPQHEVKLLEYQGTRSAITAFGGMVYWTTSTGLILSFPTIGGELPQALATGQQDPIAITAHGESIFWLDRRQDPDKDAVMRSANGLVSAVAMDPGSTTGLAVDSTHVYWTVADGDASGAVKRVSRQSGNFDDLEEPEVIALMQPFPYAIAVDKTHVYWTNKGDGTVMRAPIDGGGTPEMLASGQRNPIAIAVDDQNVYWANAGTAAKKFADGAIMKKPR